MSRTISATLCLMCALVAVAPRAAAQSKLVDTPPAVRPAPAFRVPPVAERRLPNGLRVVVVENREQPVVSFSLMVRSGGTADPDGKAGLAQMAASLLDQGTATRSAKEIAEAIESAGGSLSASAAWDATTASATVLANRTALAAELLADVVRNPAFKDDEIERIRTQTLNALQVSRADAGTVADEVFDRVVFEGTPYARPLSGTAATVRAITRDDLVAFHRTHFAPDNATLAIVGDITAKDGFALAEQYLGSWPKPDRPGMLALKRLETKPTTTRIIILDKPDAAQTEIRVGHGGFARNDPGYFQALVANAILGGAPFSSRVENELRVKRGLTYGAGSAFDTRRLHGSFQVETDTKTATTAEAVKVILDEIARFRAGGATAEELEQRKNFLTGVFLVSLETPAGIASRLLQAELYGLGADYLATYNQRIQGVTADDVRRTAESRIRPGEFVIVLAGNAKEFEEQVKQFGPVEKIPFDEVDPMSATLRAERPAAAAVSEADAKAGMALAERTIAALGGEAWVTMKSLSLKGTGSLTPAPGRTLPIQSIRSMAVYPDRNFAEIDLGIALIQQGSVGDTGWAKTPQGIQDASGQVKEGRNYGVEVLRRLRQGGLTARPIADAEVDGKAAKGFALVDAEGHETEFWADAQTGLLLKIAYTNKQGRTEIFLKEYRLVSGIQVPARVEQWRDGNKFLEAVYSDIQVNVDVDPKVFEKPAS
jgi:predicted Zn-dependent peptidase